MFVRFESRRLSSWGAPGCKREVTNSCTSLACAFAIHVHVLRLSFLVASFCSRAKLVAFGTMHNARRMHTRRTPGVAITCFCVHVCPNAARRLLIGGGVAGLSDAQTGIDVQHSVA